MKLSGAWSQAMKETRMKKLFGAIHRIMVSLYNTIYGLVLHSFKSINRKIRSKLPVWRMKEETLEHVRSSVKVFKLLILPVSLLYACAVLIYYGENIFGSILWGILIFFYSNFLPDLPSIYRKKKNKAEARDLPWYKKYALLLFAPLLIWILFSGIRLTWRTTETFHNFKSLTVYSAFLLLLGFLGFVNFPVSFGNMTEIFSVPLYGIIGYLTHLKVDKIW